MADLFWYELSLSDPDLYMEAQTKYLKALADFLSPEPPAPKDYRASPASDLTLKIYSPDISDRGKTSSRSLFDEVPVQGMKADFLTTMRSYPDPPTTARRSVRHTKNSLSVNSERKTIKPQSKLRPPAKTRASKPAARRSNSTLSLMQPKPVFVKLIQGGSKPPGDVCSVASSAGEDIELETLLTTERDELPTGAFVPLCDRVVKKCPFCGVAEDVESDPANGLKGPKSRLMLKNGGWKDFLPDGSVVSQLPNGDFKHTFPRGQIVYVFSRERVVQVIYPLKHTVSLFPNGQLEVVCPSGKKFVCFPDKTAAFVHSDGTLEDIDSYLC